MSNTTDVILECRGLTKTYYSTDPPAQVLNGIDLSVRTGEFLVIMGASGSGKSTLLYTVSGMDRPTSGTVILQGRDLTSLTDAEMSEVRLTQMGFIFQHGYFLANLNIRDNILLPALKAAPGGKEAAIARVDALLKRFGISDVQRHGITRGLGWAVTTRLHQPRSRLRTGRPVRRRTDGGVEQQHVGRGHGRLE